MSQNKPFLSKSSINIPKNRINTNGILYPPKDLVRFFNGTLCYKHKSPPSKPLQEKFQFIDPFKSFKCIEKEFYEDKKIAIKIPMIDLGSFINKNNEKIFMKKKRRVNKMLKKREKLYDLDEKKILQDEIQNKKKRNQYGGHNFNQRELILNPSNLEEKINKKLYEEGNEKRKKTTMLKKRKKPKKYKNKKRRSRGVVEIIKEKKKRIFDSYYDKQYNDEEEQSIEIIDVEKEAEKFFGDEINEQISSPEQKGKEQNILSLEPRVTEKKDETKDQKKSVKYKQMHKTEEVHCLVKYLENQKESRDKIKLQKFDNFKPKAGILSTKNNGKKRSIKPIRNYYYYGRGPKTRSKKQETTGKQNKEQESVRNKGVVDEELDEKTIALLFDTSIKKGTRYQAPLPDKHTGCFISSTIFQKIGHVGEGRDLEYSYNNFRFIQSNKAIGAKGKKSASLCFQTSEDSIKLRISVKKRNLDDFLEWDPSSISQRFKTLCFHLTKFVKNKYGLNMNLQDFLQFFKICKNNEEIFMESIRNDLLPFNDFVDQKKDSK